jgi:ubiquinone/menaquinone biosynthesis C-methylase UbiE
MKDVPEPLPNPEAHKQRVSGIFNSVADGYDDPARRLFPLCADHIVNTLCPQPGWKVLDAATGTGFLAMALAQTVHPGGRILGIDLSEGMLAQAETKLAKRGLSNVDLLQMDAEAPKFCSNYFNAVTCAFGLFFIPDMVGALQQWRRVTCPGGTVLFSSFTENNFGSLGDIFTEDAKAAGVDLATRPIAHARLKKATVCRNLMLAAGYADVEQRVVQMGYYLRDAQDWWTVVWNSSMRRVVEILDERLREAFRCRHLERIAALQDERGVWMDVEARLTWARVPIDTTLKKHLYP